MKRQTPRQRFQEIVAVFVRYGMREGIAKPAQLRQALEELGPAFVKIAQILSTRPDILSDAYIEEFQKLQDDVKPVEFGAVRQIVERELGAKLEDAFDNFLPHPVASASIAQAHRAQLKDGTQVVVKVKRPRIEEKIFSDLRLLRQVSNVVRFLPQGSVWDPVDVVDELRQALELELNFLHEGSNLDKFARLHQGIRYIKIPQVFTMYTTRDILVLEYIDGIKLLDKIELARLGYDLEEITAKIVHNFLVQVFEHGVFHADLHPGNILISGRKIAFLDFGLVGELDQRLRERLSKLLLGIYYGDINDIVNAVINIGVKKGRIDRTRLYSEVEQLYNNYISASVYDIDVPQLVEEIFRVCRQNKIAFPRDVTLLAKGILVLEGVANNLAPNLAIMELMAPYIRSQLLSRRTLQQEVLALGENLHRASRSSLRIPDKALEILNKVAAGTAKVQMDHLRLGSYVNDMKKSLNRIVFALIVSALIVGSSLVISADAGPELFSVSILGLIGYLGAGVMGLWLLVSILRSGKI